MVEVFPFLTNRRLNGIGGGESRDGNLPEVFGFGGLECSGDPLDGLRVPTKFHVFESCGFGEVKWERCCRRA